MNIVIRLSIFIVVISGFCADLDLNISSDSPIAEGTSITFNVTFLIDGKPAPKKDYQYRWTTYDGREMVSI